MILEDFLFICLFIRIESRSGWSPWHLPNFLLDFFSVSPNLMAQAEERLYQGLLLQSTESIRFRASQLFRLRE